MSSKKNANNTVLQTLQIGWITAGTLDATAAEADVALAVTERDYDTNKALDNIVAWKVPYGINAAEIRFLLSTNNADVDIDVWLGRRDKDGDASLVRAATLDVICGNGDVGDNKAADTITISNEAWITSMKSVVPGAEHEARLVLDLCGYDLIVFHGYGTFDEDCIVQCSGY